MLVLTGQFKHWLVANHLGAMTVTIEYSSGSRQDLAVEDAAVVYWNRRYVLYRYYRKKQEDEE